jgi:hypothetical protein
MDFKIGDLVSRTRYVAPIYVIYKTYKDWIYVKAITQTSIKLIYDRGRKEARLIDYYYMNYDEQYRFNKDYLFSTKTSWNIIPIKKACEFVQNHQLYDIVQWEKFQRKMSRKGVIYPKPYVQRFTQYSVKEKRNSVIMYNGHEAYSPIILKPIHGQSKP